MSKFDDEIIAALHEAGDAVYASKVYEIVTERRGSNVSFGRIYSRLEDLVERRLVRITEAHDGKRPRLKFSIYA